MNKARNFIDSETLEKYIMYFVTNLPKLYKTREQVMQNLIEQSKLSNTRDYLSGDIKKCLNLEKKEKFLNEYISKIIGYNQLRQMVYMFNQYIKDLSRISDRCKNPKISVDVQKIELFSRDDLKGNRFIQSSSNIKGNTLKKIGNLKSTPINSLTARVVRKSKRK